MTSLATRLPVLTPLERLEMGLSRSLLARRLFERTVGRASVLLERRRWRARQDPRDLAAYERQFFSQGGEDGVVEELLRRTGVGNRFAVEIGIGNGSECCTRYLIEQHGWSACLIEASAPGADHARQLYAGAHGVSVVNAKVTAENVLAILEAARAPHELDLLVIDIDGNDYWIWERVLAAYRPRMTVIEYNARWAPPRAWVMPYDADHSWDGSAYFGASLESLAQLGIRCGQTLVGCGSNGVNAYFVRRDLVDDQFVGAGRGAAHYYAPPTYGRGFGHPLVALRPRP